MVCPFRGGTFAKTLGILGSFTWRKKLLHTHVKDFSTKMPKTAPKIPSKPQCFHEDSQDAKIPGTGPAASPGRDQKKAFIFPVERFVEVANVVNPRKRRVLSAGHRAALAASPRLSGSKRRPTTHLLAPSSSPCAETVAQLEADRAKLGSRLAYTEEEAARLLGLEPHQLRDERGRGRITFSRIVGRRIRYTPEDLAEYLRRSRENA
jgi:hypothetical protein